MKSLLRSNSIRVECWIQLRVILYHIFKSNGEKNDVHSISLQLENEIELKWRNEIFILILIVSGYCFRNIASHLYD